MIVTPGFICAHTHLYGILLRASKWFSVIDPPTDFQQNSREFGELLMKRWAMRTPTSVP